MSCLSMARELRTVIDREYNCCEVQKGANGCKIADSSGQERSENNELKFINCAAVMVRRNANSPPAQSPVR